MQESLFDIVSQFVLQFDMFGYPPTFRILGKQKYNTIIGAFLTLGTIFFALVYLVVGIQELVAKDSPNVIQSERQVVETQPFYLNRNNFTIAITMADLDNQPLTTINKYFTIQLKNCESIRIYNETTQTTSLTRNCTIIPLEACTKDHFLSEAQIEYFSKIRLGSVQCIRKDYWDSYPPVLQGIKTSVIYSSLTITVSVCQNSTNNYDCAPLDDIKQQLNSGYYAVHMSDSLLQMNRAVNMSIDVINIQYNTFSITTSKNIVQQFKVVKTLTDSGLVFSDISQQQVIIQDTLRESTDLYNDEYLVLHTIILSSKYSEYSRSYVKIQAILSRVGGLYQIIFLILAAFIKPIVQLMLDIDMANELFRFESNNNKDKSYILNDTKLADALAGIVKSKKRLLSPRDAGRLNSEHIQEVMINESLKEILQKRNQIEPTIKQILCLYIGCDRKKKKMLNIAKERYMEKLDVKLIIKKDIILTEEQMKLFKYLPKPNIIQDLEKGKCLDSQKQSQQLESIAIQEAFEAYEKVIQQITNSAVNLKLIQSLDPEIQMLFQSIQKSQTNQFLNQIPLNQSKVRFDVGDLAECQSIQPESNCSPQRIYVAIPKKISKYHETQ